MKTPFEPALKRALNQLRLLTPVAALATLAACTFTAGPPYYRQPINVSVNPQQYHGDALGPLFACAQQRGLPTERFGDLLQVRVDQDTMVEYHYDNARNLVMGARFIQPIPPIARAERSELAHARGNEIFACAGYGTPVYLGATEPAAPPPQVYAAQPMPGAPPPPNYGQQDMFANRPMCGRLDRCVDEATRETCPPGDMRCFEGFRMRAAQENDCRDGMDRVAHRIEEMRRERPGLRLPEACLVPNNAMAGAPPAPQLQPMGPNCEHLQVCYRDLTTEACRNHNNAHCDQAFQMRTHDEPACEMALREITAHMEDMRRNNPGFILPGSCHPR